MVKEGGFLREHIYADIEAEIKRQTEKWGTNTDLEHPLEWMLVVDEEIGEVAKALNEHYFRDMPFKPVEEELIQVIAVIVSWIETERMKR